MTRLSKATRTELIRHLGALRKDVQVIERCAELNGDFSPSVDSFRAHVVGFEHALHIVLGIEGAHALIDAVPEPDEAEIEQDAQFDVAWHEGRILMIGRILIDTDGFIIWRLRTAVGILGQLDTDRNGHCAVRMFSSTVLTERRHTAVQAVRVAAKQYVDSDVLWRVTNEYRHD